MEQRLLLGNGGLWVSVGMIPAFYALAMTLAHNPAFTRQPFVRTEALLLVGVTWAYLLTAFLGAWFRRTSAAPEAQPRRMILVTFLPAVLLAAPMTSGKWTDTALAYGPLLAGAGLTQGVVFYHAGW